MFDAPVHPQSQIPPEIDRAFREQRRLGRRKAIRTVGIVLLLFAAALAVGWQRWWASRKMIREIARLGGRYTASFDSSPNTVPPEGLMALIATDRNIASIEFDHARLTDEFIDRVRSFPQPVSLAIDSVDEGKARLSRLSEIPNLRYLHFFVPWVTDRDAAAFSGLTSLQRLYLDGSPIGDAGLAHLAGLTSLLWLSLADTRVTDAGLEHLAGMSQLDRLDLSHTRVIGTGFAHLPKAGMTHVLLSHSLVTDDGLAHLNGTPIKVLELEDTAISDAAIEHLAAIPTLQLVKLRNSSVTAAGAERLRAALPRADIRLR